MQQVQQKKQKEERNKMIMGIPLMGIGPSSEDGNCKDFQINTESTRDLCCVSKCRIVNSAYNS